jgi:hypothetical protein
MLYFSVIPWIKGRNDPDDVQLIPDLRNLVAQRFQDRIFAQEVSANTLSGSDAINRLGISLGANMAA